MYSGQGFVTTIKELRRRHGMKLERPHFGKREGSGFTDRLMITYLFLGTSVLVSVLALVSVAGAAVLVAGLVVVGAVDGVAAVDWRFENEELPSLLRTVLTRESTLPKPFFSFSSLGAEASAGAEELMMLVNRRWRLSDTKSASRIDPRCQES